MPKTVLVIEDDKALARALARRLEAHGHAVHVAYDGREGLRLTRAEPPDLVLLDIIMPEQDGIEVLTKMAASGRRSKVVAMSSGGPYRGLDLLDLALALGADATLRKPFDLGAMAQMVAELVG
jgi:DNA-binding response OmpR family regulator